MHTNRLFRVIVLFILIGMVHLAEVPHLNGIQLKGYANSLKEEEMKTPMQVEITLRRMYLNGETSEETIIETIYSIENFWAKYEEWQYIGMENEKLIFTKEIDDISPLLKANGYFGVTDDGILSIFNGKPYKSHIIHSFFQIDVGKLESHKREELKEGIPIKTKDRYIEVLETFKTYSNEEKEAK